MRKTLLAALLVGASAPAGAQFNAGVGQTVGSDGYKETAFQAEIGLGAMSLAPSYSFYSSDLTTSAFKTASARAGFDTRVAGLGVTAGTTFKEERYSNFFAGADAAISLTPGKGFTRRIGGPGRSQAPAGAGLARVDAGAGVLLTKHKLDSSATSTGADLAQTDLFGYVGAAFLGVDLSARLTVSSYDKDPKTAAVPSPLRVGVEGVLPASLSYPETAVHIKGEWTMLPMVKPFVSYTTVKFEPLAGGVQPGDVRALTAGGSLGLQMLEVHASYQLLTLSGGSDSSFFNVGAGLRF